MVWGFLWVFLRWYWWFYEKLWGWIIKIRTTLCKKRKHTHITGKLVGSNWCHWTARNIQIEGFDKLQLVIFGTTANTLRSKGVKHVFYRYLFHHRKAGNSHNSQKPTGSWSGLGDSWQSKLYLQKFEREFPWKILMDMRHVFGLFGCFCLAFTSQRSDWNWNMSWWLFIGDNPNLGLSLYQKTRHFQYIPFT